MLLLTVPACIEDEACTEIQCAHSQPTDTQMKTQVCRVFGGSLVASPRIFLGDNLDTAEDRNWPSDVETKLGGLYSPWIAHVRSVASAISNELEIIWKETGLLSSASARKQPPAACQCVLGY